MLLEFQGLTFVSLYGKSFTFFGTEKLTEESEHTECRDLIFNSPFWSYLGLFLFHIFSLPPLSEEFNLTGINEGGMPY
ncbi:hypothetical protein Goklo_007177 [Gossypium klotzschianum]|uniref:Uncharacterized protein n=1 Tax=Gossypium klotzschianum TaxID=34286 RepID=A0A7J8VL16_9ROSI|nr:hypothetical protein [Gossypium klotzschianum]